KGFIVTDRTLFWNFDQTESIPSHSAVFKIETDETQPKLNINDSTFFLQKLTATQAQELCSFLSLTVEQDKAPEELPSVIKQLPLVTERDILDRAGLFFDSAFNLLDDLRTSYHTWIFRFCCLYCFHCSPHRCA
ncbi:MAG: hypothetical protein IIT58_03710, partial [Treponema sp.]|nr:hypothetical protein [Treponema sp.]